MSSVDTAGTKIETELKFVEQKGAVPKTRTPCGKKRHTKTVFTKTPKVLLNQNAEKFKLKSLEGTDFRYENIYKNLLREAKRSFITLFNNQT